MKFSFSTPRQHDSEAGPVAPAKPAISLPMDSVPPKMSFSSQLNPLPGTQPLLLRFDCGILLLYAVCFKGVISLHYVCACVRVCCACVYVCVHVCACLCVSYAHIIYIQYILAYLLHMCVCVPFFSGSIAAVRGSERKPLPLKSGSCLDILKPSKPAVEDKDSQGRNMSTTENVCIKQFLL